MKVYYNPKTKTEQIIFVSQNVYGYPVTAWFIAQYKPHSKYYQNKKYTASKIFLNLPQSKKQKKLYLLTLKIKI